MLLQQEKVSFSPLFPLFLYPPSNTHPLQLFQPLFYILFRELPTHTAGLFLYFFYKENPQQHADFRSFYKHLIFNFLGFYHNILDSLILLRVCLHKPISYSPTPISQAMTLPSPKGDISSCIRLRLHSFSVSYATLPLYGPK